MLQGLDDAEASNETSFARGCDGGGVTDIHDADAATGDGIGRTVHYQLLED